MPKIYSNNSPVTKLSLGPLLSEMTPGSSVLEFGPGGGYMTRFMKEELHCKITCIELIPEMAAMAAPFAEKMIIADLEKDEWEKEIKHTFDYIIFGDVLEHLRHPSAAIRRVLPFLSEKGFILTSIPNIAHNAIIMSLRRNKFEYTNFGLLDDTHIHFFTRGEMNHVFSENNMVCLEEKSIVKRPSGTELKAYYLKNILLIYPLIRRKDGHVYQFVCKWGKKDVYADQEIRQKEIRLNFLEACWCLMVDMNDYIYDRWNVKLKLPKRLKPRNSHSY